MSMIDPISMSMSASSNVNTSKALSEDIQKKLKDLGINPNAVTSEAEAKKIIQKAEENNQSNSNDKQSSDNDSLLKRARDLATKIGLGFSDDDDVKTLIKEIKIKLEAMLTEAENNPSQIMKIQQWQSDLAMIEMQEKGASGSNEILMNSLMMLAEYNKQQMKPLNEE